MMGKVLAGKLITATNSGNYEKVNITQLGHTVYRGNDFFRLPGYGYCKSESAG